jgi:ribosome modulation factor
MKKHKRDASHRCYVKGYQNAIQGRSLSNCPYQENTTRSYEWFRGWREGRVDLWSGYNQQVCQKKAGNLCLNH